MSIGCIVPVCEEHQDNIGKSELSAFKKLAKVYEGLSDEQIKLLLKQKEFVEICNGEKVQK